MARPVLEVADIFRDHGPAWRKANAGHVSLGQLKVMSAIESCRTAALGGHVMRCEDCSHTAIAYNSCRNRHCPKCQGSQALAGSSGKLARPHLQIIAETDKVGDVADAPSAFGRCHSPCAKSEPDVLGNAHVRPERKILKHHADAARPRRRVSSSSRRNDLSIQPNLAAIGCNQSGDEQQCGRFTAA